MSHCLPSCCGVCLCCTCATQVEKTYTVELTVPQLRILLEMASSHEFYKLGKGLGSHTKEEADVYMKVSDAMQRYYDDAGITD